MMRAIIVVICLLLISAIALAAGPSSPPPELVQLEREVSLKMAHARDEGYTDAPRRKMLAEAQALDASGEKAMVAGEYERAENDFLKAKLMLHNLGI